MARKWTKWAIGVTGATTFAVSLGLIQMNKTPAVADAVFSSLDSEQVNSVFAKDSIFARTIQTIKENDFIAMPYFVSYEYEKEGMGKKEFEQYLLTKESVLSSLDWGVDVVPQKQISTPTQSKSTQTKSDRKSRGSR